MSLPITLETIMPSDIIETIMKLFEDQKEKHFILITTALSFLISVLYVWKGLTEGFYPGTHAVIFMSFIYIPVVWIFRRPGFAIFNLAYAAVLVFIIAFNDTYLYNNFTGLIAVFIVMMVAPKLKWVSLATYILATIIAFALNEENLCHFFIHIARCGWLFHIFNHVLSSKYKRNKLILYDDERKILTELSKNRLQKAIELEGFSESTIYRRIKAAMKRNNLTKKQLIEEFKKEQTEN